MIVLANLTTEQVAICDKLWGLATLEEVDRFINSLSTDAMKHTARVLQHMIIAAVHDADVQTMDDCIEARTILTRISSYN